MDRAVTGTTRVTGVFGYPVHHSQSPAMHNTAFRELGLDFVYVPFSVRPDDLESAVRGIRSLDIVGVNLTIPHKERVIEYLDWVSDDAKRIKSVNTIHQVGGVLKGYSTDGPGFIKALEASGKSPVGSKAVVLGAGGSARATVYALVTSGAEVTVVNRTGSRAVELAEQLNLVLAEGIVKPIALDSTDAARAVREADLLVNCTPVGMYPHIDAQLIPSEWLHEELFVFDQVYNPLETNLLKAARSAGAGHANGIKMLVFQGALSFEIWTGQAPPVKAMEDAVIRGLQTQPSV
ncbi:MAG: shikimate dehydrogenase [Armatimonadetes bacterium]|nr:shikimate dehydrogenase [Armatimonadota bacterium]